MRPSLTASSLVCVVLLATGCPRRVPGSEMNKVDARSALWLEEAGQGRPWNPEGLVGRVTLVNFFATWCFPCLGQLVLLGDFQEELGPRGLQVVAIGMDLEGERVLGPFARSEARPFPVLIADEAIRKGETPFGRIPVVPATFLLGRDGRVLRAWPGLPEAEALRAAIEREL
jgi:thiol-disulfide isomerase/thioredoxin